MRTRCRVIAKHDANIKKAITIRSREERARKDPVHRSTCQFRQYNTTKNQPKNLFVPSSPLILNALTEVLKNSPSFCVIPRRHPPQQPGSEITWPNSEAENVLPSTELPGRCTSTRCQRTMTSRALRRSSMPQGESLVGA